MVFPDLGPDPNHRHVIWICNCQYWSRLTSNIIEVRTASFLTHRHPLRRRYFPESTPDRQKWRAGTGKSYNGLYHQQPALPGSPWAEHGQRRRQLEWISGPAMHSTTTSLSQGAGRGRFAHLPHRIPGCHPSQRSLEWSRDNRCVDESPRIITHDGN